MLKWEENKSNGETVGCIGFTTVIIYQFRIIA